MSAPAVLINLLRLHACNARPDKTVGECVDQGLCACTCGLLIGRESSDGFPERAAVEGNR